jgi:hypothetical protein
MDLTSFFAGAAMLIFVAYGGTEFFKWVFDLDPVADKRWLALVVVLVSFTAVFGLRYSDWSHEQVVGTKVLDSLGIVSLLLVSVLLVFLEVATFFLVQLGARAVSNIGYNQPSKLPPGLIPAQVNPSKVPDTANLSPFDGAHAQVDPADLGLPREQLLALGYSAEHLDAAGITEP